MGLDVVAYKKLTKIENPELDEDGDCVNSDYWQSSDMGNSETFWKGRGEGVEPNTTYSYESEMSFHAGSYSGYNCWRKRLEEFSHLFSDDDPNVFIELIDFSDCEGTIGSVVSDKLYKDFINHRYDAKKFFSSISYDLSNYYWLEKYDLFTKAFEYASDGGAVCFV